MKGWKAVGVELPRSVCAIVEAAGGTDPKRGGMPYAMASIIGALPWLAAALSEQLSPVEYADFVRMMKANLQQAWSVIESPDPPTALTAAIKAAQRQVQ